MADSRRYADWYQKAETDLRGAQILSEHGADNSLVAFHCQQAIEKIIKGYILRETGRLLEGHSLVYLVRSASAFDGDFRRFMKDCAFVNQFYVETRYPADVPAPVDERELAECIDTAKEVVGYIRGKE